MPKHTVSTSHVDEQYPVKWQWLHRLIDRRSFQIFVLIVVCILNIVDLLVDWYFFVSKATIQKVRTKKKHHVTFLLLSQGLVFGPPPHTTLMAIFSFCIISTFTSILEIIQVTRDTYRKRLTSRFGQITNCLTLWLEDVPLLTLNLLIVICRDGEVTRINLAKSIIGIIAASIRSLSILLNKWLIRHDYQRKDRLSQFFNTISTIGVVLVFMISIAIHVIANLPTDHFGRLYLRSPADFQQFKFAHQKYFDHVGLFLHSSDEYEKYIYLTDIENIINNRSTTFVYGIDKKKEIFCLKQSNQTCFIQSNNSSHLQIYEKNLSDKLINYSITFQYQQPDFYYLLGDIHYNIIRCDLKDFYIDDMKIVLHYFPLKSKFYRTKFPLISNENETLRYYDPDTDFESMAELWQTGLSKCTSTSTYTPHRSIYVQVNTSFC